MRLSRTWLAWLIVAIGLITIGASAAPAGADGTGCCTLQLVPSGPTGTVGVPFLFTATGSVAPISLEYLAVDAIPTSVTSTCPPNQSVAEQVAPASGGAQVAFAEAETLDANGNFSLPVVYTPSQPGTLLFCAYSDEGGTTADAVAAPVIVTFLANGGGGGSTGGGGGGGSTGGGGGRGAVKPANTARPRVIRSGGQLRCTHGRWADSPTRFGYRWLVGGKTNAGGTGATLAITRRVRGRKVECVVMASNTAGSTSARSALFSVH